MLFRILIHSNLRLCFCNQLHESKKSHRPSRYYMVSIISTSYVAGGWAEISLAIDILHSVGWRVTAVCVPHCGAIYYPDTSHTPSQCTLIVEDR